MIAFALQTPLVIIGYAVDRLRRLPGAAPLSRLVPGVLLLVFLGGGLLLLLWGAERAPVRISLADLATGNRPWLQSWYIVSGDVAVQPLTDPSARRYVMTDRAAKNARLLIYSPVSLPTGWTTVSGTLEGGLDPAPAGFAWVGLLRADAELAQELPPPWSGVAALVLALFLGWVRGTSYPMFFGERPRPLRARATPVRVSVRQSGVTSGERDYRARIRFDGRSDGVMLVPDPPSTSTGLEVPVRLHSAYTGLDVGIARELLRATPVLRVRAAAEDLTLSFTARDDRDATYGALIADARRRAEMPLGRSTRAGVASPSRR